MSDGPQALHGAAVERGPDLDRLLTFIDAIVAIAITLLVLPLVDLAADVDSRHPVTEVLRHNSGKFSAFALSFFIIARLWLAQHRSVRPARDASGFLSWSLIAWSATVVFLPFPTALLDSSSEEPVTKTLYVGTMLVSSMMLALVTLAVRRQCPPDSPQRPSAGAAGATVIIVGLALAICLLVPSAGFFPLIVLTVPQRVAGIKRIMRFVRRRRSVG